MRNYRVTILCIIALLLTVYTKETEEKSPIEDVSDEVYGQSVEYYFFVDTSKNTWLNGWGGGSRLDWYKEDSLYEESLEYAEQFEKEHGTKLESPPLPNPLMFEYDDAYDKLRLELKEELKTKEEDNMFKDYWED